ncbi:hypothetical protein PVW48_11800 [Dinoroseobacter sp. PD6]|uniref:hypothetical protein n=1 Tax=Dinoroseobacter sp. PD6 TaxID=3028384 RepID=UPI00237B0CBE|nr:hypothetical protein [Dinoroseobacter sp. PD6]MDD9717434.1 hypothetical protein [Dinoroseobacter sp. PD6]
MLIRLVLLLALWAPATALAQACTSAPEVCNQILSAKQDNDAGAPKDALDHLRKAQETAGIDTQWVVYLLGQKATAYSQSGNSEQSLAAIASALEFRPNDVWLLLQSCRLHAASSFLAKAQRDCARVRTLMRRTKDKDLQAVQMAHLVHAEAQLALIMRYPDLALEKLESLDGSGIPLRFIDDLRASALSMLGDHAAAKQALDRVLALATDEPEASRAALYQRRGFEQIALGTVDAGLVDLETAVATAREVDDTVPDRDSALAQYLYGLCAVHLQREAAEAALEWCGALSETETGQTSHVFLDAYGLAQMRNGLYEAAAETFAKALDLVPRSTQSYRHLQQSVRLAQDSGLPLVLDDYVDDRVRLLQPN